MDQYSYACHQYSYACHQYSYACHRSGVLLYSAVEEDVALYLMFPFPFFFVSESAQRSMLCVFISLIISWSFLFHDVTFQHPRRSPFVLHNRFFLEFVVSLFLVFRPSSEAWFAVLWAYEIFLRGVVCWPVPSTLLLYLGLGPTVSVYITTGGVVINIILIILFLYMLFCMFFFIMYFLCFRKKNYKKLF